jgi:hypothetical protein
MGALDPAKEGLSTSTLDPSDLLRARLLLVSGKGGTGKTTFSVALAQTLASMGRRVLLLEVDDHQSALVDYFGTAPRFEPTQVDAGLHIAHVSWLEGLEDWLLDEIPVVRVVRVIVSHRLIRLFVDATPGSRELLVFARILKLLKAFDTVVVDLPASGHAVSFFRVPHSSVALFPTGPIHTLCRRILEVLADGSTRSILCSMPEDMILNETLETWHAIRRLAPGMEPPSIVLNQGIPSTLGPDEALLLERLRRQRDRRPLDDDGQEARRRELLRAGVWEAERARATEEALLRIRRETTARTLLIPILSTGEGPAEVSRRLRDLLENPSSPGNSGGPP